MRRVLCLHLPLLPIERIRRRGLLSPAERKRPLVLTERVGAVVRVVACDDAALAAGVRIGVTLGQAQAALPNLVARPHDPPRDQRLLRRLANWSLRFSPTIEPHPPQPLLVDLTGCQRFFGGDEPVLNQACDALTRGGFTVRGAIADTVGAAWALAHDGADARSVVAPGAASAALAPLPPAALRLAPQVVDQLHLLGIRKIADLLMLPRSTLPGRFGPELVERLQQALGEIPEPISAQRDQSPPAVRLNLDTPLTEPGPFAALVQQLLAELIAEIEQRDLGLQQFDLIVYFPKAEAEAQTVRLSRPSRAWRHVRTLLGNRIERVNLAHGAVGVTLIARRTARWRPAQETLFEDRTAQDDADLGVLIDQLNTRLGPAAVVQARLIDDHQPEQAYQWVPALSTPTPQTRRPPPHAAAPTQRPVRLLSRPLRVRTIALQPDGPPTWFAYGGHEHQVATAWGPERLATGWWRGPDVQRDYFRVRTQAGEDFWLFRAPDGWYLHGVYA